MISRCCICGKELWDPKSVNRGIGPVCDKIIEQKAKQKVQWEENIEYFANKSEPKEKPLGIEIFEKLKLPCNHYDCIEGSCPFATFKRCPRMRVYIKKDIYPLYQKKLKECSFCGKALPNGNYTKNIFKSKITLECAECKNKNKSWRDKK